MYQLYARFQCLSTYSIDASRTKMAASKSNGRIEVPLVVPAAVTEAKVATIIFAVSGVISIACYINKHQQRTRLPKLSPHI